ncbi:hypothetical protein RN001_006612 [Aquatica leii]|uniref:Dynein regulatory complex subunit 2 n=1 Tax=Aquatica leii TaxID=1421715 RepID=A0AAN7QL35_9COLE|nr:hypothetical protein RN001_006612 [Aquatica leii]
MPALSAEEKAALKEAKKREKQRQDELRRRQLRHDYLSREVKFAQINIKQHETKWKKMLIGIALPRMRADLEYAWHSFERIIDFKDFEISLLLDELNDGEEQSLMNFRNHSEHIHNLFLKYGDYLKNFQKDYEANLNQVKADSEKEVEEIRKKSDESEEYYKTMLFGLEVAKKEQERLVRGDYLSKLDEESNKYNNIIQNLQANLERKYCDFWDSTTSFLKSNQENTEDRRKLYEVLSVQDDALQKVCVEQSSKLLAMQKSFKKLKDHFMQVQKAQEIKISDLMSERQYFADAFWTLKIRLSLDKDVDSSSLTLLTVESNDIREHLTYIVKKGKTILKLAAVCRKLETLSEKILPFPQSSEEKERIEPLDEKHLNSIGKLDKFWQRVAQADAIRHSINEEREYLKKANLALKQKIHHYCKCLECPPPEVKHPEKNKSKVNSSSIPITDCQLFAKQYQKFK